MENEAGAILVAGSNGMVGSAIIRRLKDLGFNNVVGVSRDEVDLTCQDEVYRYLKALKPEKIYLAAAKVGGIYANSTYPAEFIYENLAIQTNMIHGAHLAGVSKLLFLGSSCIYPKLANQPMKEEALLSGYLESTNEPYAIAKISGIKMCESYCRQFGRDYRSVMPTNLYGPNDNFHKENSHVIPALLGRFHEAVVKQKEKVIVWGSGSPMREFLHVDDMASACIHIMGLANHEYRKVLGDGVAHINIGTGEDVKISDLVKIICEVTGFSGQVLFDTSKPDGTPRKLLDVSRIRVLGWECSIPLKQGLQDTYAWFLQNEESIRGG